AALIEPFHARGLPVTQVYGGTETGPVATFLRPEHAMDHVGSCGCPAIWSDIRIVDDECRDLPTGAHGELLVRGPMVIRRYWRNESATQESFDGDWFCTGDIGYYDPDGFLWIAGRKKDVIISGGESIYPAELEMVLEECPDLVDSAVVQRPDDRWGEVPVAVVVRRKESRIDRAGVLALFEGRLGHYKHPKDVIFLDELPRTALGKVQKDRLRVLVLVQGS
ncbi:MAG: AMP-binding protein, partial [Proteobacteria bacterium]|nr:AMP-binding protein [Pseudomonadota bacterium]